MAKFSSLGAGCGGDLLVEHIVSRTSAEDLMLMYNLPAFTKGDRIAFLAGVARSNHLVKKVCWIDLVQSVHLIIFFVGIVRFVLSGENLTYLEHQRLYWGIGIPVNFPVTRCLLASEETEN